MTTQTPIGPANSAPAQGNRVKQILIGLVLGVLLALVSKPAAIAGLLGTLFVGALKSRSAGVGADAGDGLHR